MKSPPLPARTLDGAAVHWDLNGSCTPSAAASTKRAATMNEACVQNRDLSPETFVARARPDWWPWDARRPFAEALKNSARAVHYPVCTASAQKKSRDILTPKSRVRRRFNSHYWRPDLANLALRSLTKSYGTTQVLHGISLDVADGEFVVLSAPRAAENPRRCG